MQLLKTKLLCVLIIGMVTATGWGQDFSAAPPQHLETPFRIGYLEGGAFPDYQIIFLRIVEGLMELGWIKPTPLPDTYDSDHRRVWEWVADNIQSDYLTFIKDAFYTSGFKVELREETRNQILQRLQTEKDIDLVLAMGTWAGLDLATDAHAVPVVVASTSDPIASGIVKSADDSGLDHLHAKVEPDRYFRQIVLFHNIIGFNRLGVVYEDTAEGRTFAALDDVEAAAASRNFDVASCLARANDVTPEQASAEVIQCYQELSPQVDALYITVHQGQSLSNLPAMLQPLLQHKVATFAMAGSEFVRHGALLSIAQAGFRHVARFHAETIGKILNGALPRSLPQKWVDPPIIAVNLKTAELIGFNPPFDVLTAADEIYEDIPTRIGN